MKHCKNCACFPRCSWDGKYAGTSNCNDYVEPRAKVYQRGREDTIAEAIHRLDNAKAMCHEDYVDGIDFAIGVLENVSEQIKRGEV